MVHRSRKSASLPKPKLPCPSQATWACMAGTSWANLRPAATPRGCWFKDTWPEMPAREGQHSWVGHLSQWDLGRGYKRLALILLLYIIIIYNNQSAFATHLTPDVVDSMPSCPFPQGVSEQGGPQQSTAVILAFGKLRQEGHRITALRLAATERDADHKYTDKHTCFKKGNNDFVKLQIQ